MEQGCREAGKEARPREWERAYGAGRTGRKRFPFLRGKGRREPGFKIPPGLGLRRRRGCWGAQSRPQTAGSAGIKSLGRSGFMSLETL